MIIIMHYCYSHQILRQFFIGPNPESIWRWLNLEDVSYINTVDSKVYCTSSLASRQYPFRLYKAWERASLAFTARRRNSQIYL